MPLPLRSDVKTLPERWMLLLPGEQCSEDSDYQLPPAAGERSLVERLEERASKPVIGLQFVSEIVNPRNARDPPYYVCSLKGCKEAWGPRDVMYHHLTLPRHQRNYYKQLGQFDSALVSCLTNSEILDKTARGATESGGAARDCTYITVLADYKKYKELRGLPADW